MISVMTILSGMAIALMTLKLTDSEKEDLKHKFVILNVSGALIAGLVIENFGSWTCMLSADIIWIISILGGSPIMSLISQSMLTVTIPLFLAEEPSKIKGALIFIIFKISISFGAVLEQIIVINFGKLSNLWGTTFILTHLVMLIWVPFPCSVKRESRQVIKFLIKLCANSIFHLIYLISSLLFFIFLFTG